ncbi:cellulase family glycosylhydrolase [Nocardioides marmoribigeumensis]|uniref:Glycoside hydrolase family 5 domain-containing protein n=1 Tax=Nocardioides marmoribigeumensis TaxID=433649 RepID=A0ABU2BTR2_9ACTN|nr:cellulase family glycosylhydrolase [Nocardioides marmoribigeumensis]MDR7362010.1 hypothetical protein [Nocardioides marmoribigeumensis]
MLDDAGRARRGAADYGPLTRFAVVAGTVIATVVATLVFLGDRTAPDPLATTPIAQAQRLAREKNLQVGMSYGGRLMFMDDAELAASLDRAVRLGAHWIRTDMIWGLIERSPGVYDWSAFDRVVDAVESRGLELLPVLLGTPPWARKQSCSGRLACPPGDVGDYADFAEAAAARYTSRGVTTWQIWNEPNIWLFWLRPRPKAYAAMLDQAAHSIRAVDPKATIVFGGLAALPPTNRVIEARAFLRAVCDLGVCKEMDVFAYHPYTYPDLASHPTRYDAPWTRIADSDDSLARILDAYGLHHVPIWITEFGAPTGGNGRASDGSIPLQAGVVDHVTEKRQAQIAFDSVATAVVTPRVKMLVWYTDVDLPDRSGKQAHYGLFRADGTPKPAWRRLKKAVRLFTR